MKPRSEKGICQFSARACVLLSVLVLTFTLGDVVEVPVEVDDMSKEQVQGKIDAFEQYVRLFETNRAIQLDAVKSIQKFGSKYEQRYKLVDTLLNQLFKVLGESKVKLTEIGFIPGDPFPEDPAIREVYSKVLENTAMFGELILRVPDMTHKIYDKNKEWEFLIGWSVWFSVESKVFRGSAEKLLNLMSQEIGLIPKDEDFMNPYREDFGMEDFDKQQQQQQTGGKNKKSDKAKKNKPAREIRKGPRLSGPRSEL